MQTIKRFFNQLFLRFMGQHVWSKFLICYFVAIFLPTVCTFVLLNARTVSQVSRRYQSDTQAYLQQIDNALLLKSEQCKYAFEVLRHSSALGQYAVGGYPSSSEEISIYLSNLISLFENIKATNFSINSVTLFRYEKGYIHNTPYIKSIDHLPLSGGDFHNMKINEVIDCVQFSDLEPELICYSPMFNYDSTNLGTPRYQNIGIIEVRIRIDDIFSSLPPDENATLLLHIAESYYAYDRGNDRFFPAEKPDPAKRTRFSTYLTHPLTNTDGELVFLSNHSYLASAEMHGQTLIFIICLILVALLFSLFAHAISSRLTRFTYHISSIPRENLLPFAEASYTDEIGVMIEAFNKMVAENNVLITQAYQQRILTRDAQYYALQTQINPHFMGNTLEQIHLLMQMHDYAQANQMMTRFKAYLRYLMGMQQKTVKLSDELEHARNYVEIHSFGTYPPLAFSIQSDVNPSLIQCPRFILQPIVENCFEHGFDQLMEKRIISIHVTESNTGVCIRIFNNGKQMEESQVAELNECFAEPVSGLFVGGSSDSHLGLRNVDARLRLCCGGRSGLQILSDPNGCTIIARIDRKVS